MPLAASTAHFIEKWHIPDFLVAIGTLVLAGVTVWLVLQTRREVTKVGEQVSVERQALQASLRPFVVPVNDGMDPAAAQLKLRNMGPGLAYNVEGAIYWRGTGGSASIVPTHVPSGGEMGVALALTGISLSTYWGSVAGYLRYTDVGETEWQTHFRYSVDDRQRIHVQVLHVGTTEDLGEPQYNPDEGWANAPDAVAEKYHLRRA